MDDFTPLSIHLNGDGAFPELQGTEFAGGSIDAVAVLADGTSNGKPSVCFKITLADGEVVLAQTTWALLCTACAAIEARYGGIIA